MGPTQTILLPFHQIFFKMFLSEDKLFSLESSEHGPPHQLDILFKHYKTLNATVIVSSFDKIVKGERLFSIEICQ